MSGKFPTANPTASFWLSEPHELHAYRSSDTTPDGCDIAIIGTGMAGVASAYHILTKCAAEHQRPSIVLFEARQACSGATGRNGGHNKNLLTFIKTIYDKHGPAVGEEFVELMGAQRRAIKATVETEDIECELLVRRSFDAYFDPVQAETMKRWLYGLRHNGVLWTQDMQWLEGPNLERITGVKNLAAAACGPAISLWPYKFVTSLLARVVGMGALLYTETPVEVVKTNGDESVTIITPRGKTNAKKVVYAANGYTSSLLPQYQGVIVPNKGQNSILKPSAKSHHGLNLAHTYNLVYSPTAVDYLVPRPDGNLILGGALNKYCINAQDMNTKWFDTVDDTTLIDESVKSHFDHTMAKHFRGWEDSEANVAMTWTGIMAATPDSLPHAGLVPGTKNQWIIAGFNGAGMTMIFTTTAGLADMVQNDKTLEETSILTAFKTTEERLAVRFP
ncbi:hypothetical protein TruAng_006928 [Truncatella angustata]|nr:hypothetical protein TruAng_006928 [Truncatella angustata]